MSIPVDQPGRRGRCGNRPGGKSRSANPILRQVLLVIWRRPLGSPPETSTPRSVSLFGPDQSKAPDKDKALHRTIVGVVRDAKYSTLRDEVAPTAYIPPLEGGAVFELPTASSQVANSGEMTAPVRKTVSDLDANLPVVRMRTQEQTIDQLLFNQRLLAGLLGVFAMLGLGSACIGVRMALEPSERVCSGWFCGGAWRWCCWDRLPAWLQPL